MDGVRQNQPFGDIVAWDLIPKIAISEVALMPGSNPLFGLNTLGGAVSIETKDGHSAPGVSLAVSGGSFGRRAGEFEYGGSNSKGLNWYAGRQSLPRGRLAGRFAFGGAAGLRKAGLAARQDYRSHSASAMPTTG